MEQYIISSILSLLNLVLIVIVWHDVRYLINGIFSEDGTDNEDRQD